MVYRRRTTRPSVIVLGGRGLRLSPVLVLSGKKGADIADGFHRVSLVYRLDPYSEVPLKLG